jgi:hypothetical protein
MYQNDYENWILQFVYNFSPKRFAHAINKPNFELGKYESDHTPEAEIRWMILAHWFDKTNVLIQYKPSELQHP